MISSRWTTYLWMIGIFLAVEALSWFAYAGSWMTWAWGGVMAMALVIGWRRPQWLALITVGELVVGGKGYLLSGTWHDQTISLRLGLFLVFFLVWLVDVIRTKRWGYPPALTVPLVVLMAWIGVMTLVGGFRGAPWSAVFFDANAFLYLGMFFFWWRFLRTGAAWAPTLMTVLLAGATVMVAKSWVVTLWFAHDYPNIVTVYRWIRQTGIGEITPMTLTASRVFFQSHIYAVFVFFLIAAAWVERQAPRWWIAPFCLMAGGIYLSLSRSLWLGTGVTVFVLLILTIRRHGWRQLWRWWILVPGLAAAFVLYAWAMNFPSVIPQPGAVARQNTVLLRLQGKNAAAADTARKNQIRPLLSAIAKHPVLGSGFGTTVTYYTTDPRIKGWRTTSAFELGYLDLWLKIGLIGVGLFAWWLWRILRRLHRTPSGLVFIGGTIALIIIHLTTPYLNHPLGLGWVLFAALNYDA